MRKDHLFVSDIDMFESWLRIDVDINHRNIILLCKVNNFQVV